MSKKKDQSQEAAHEQKMGFLPALEALEKERGISVERILPTIEDAMVKAYEKQYGSGQNINIEIDRKSGELIIWQNKRVVEVVEDPNSEMSLQEAIDNGIDDPEVGMEIEFDVSSEVFKDFGRIAAQAAKQVIYQRLREFERDAVKEEFERCMGQVKTVTVQRSERREVIVDINRYEGVIPESGLAHNEYLRKGDRIKALVVEVREGQRGPQVVFSRSSPELLKCLFESSVPEIGKGIVQIKAVVREAGLRSKIAVKSLDPNVDPVGACVGPKGTRVQGIVDELRNEKIDVIPWSDDISVLISNSLQPASVSQVIINKEANSAMVVVADQQLPLAIGREGQNARLAAKLTGWHIDIRSESNYLAEEAAKRAAQAKKAEEAAQASEAPQEEA